MPLPQLLLEIDVQRDLCERDGAAYVPSAPTHLFRKLAGYAEVRGVPIVGSVASFDWDAWPFASSERSGPNGEKGSLPAHCVRGTLGWLKVRGTLPERARFVSESGDADVEALARELVEGVGAGVYFEHGGAGLSANPASSAFLRALAEIAGGVGEVLVYGVATEGAVRDAVLELARLGLRTRVLVDAVAAREAEAGERALAQMEQAGAVLGRAEDLFEP